MTLTAHTLRTRVITRLVCVDDLLSSLEIKERKQDFIETRISLSLQ